jgi:hypothetical protein
MDPSVETLTLLAFWACQCAEPDIAGANVEQRHDGERVVAVRACRECWGDVPVHQQPSSLSDSGGVEIT